MGSDEDTNDEMKECFDAPESNINITSSMKCLYETTIHPVQCPCDIDVDFWIMNTEPREGTRGSWSGHHLNIALLQMYYTAPYPHSKM